MDLLPVSFWSVALLVVLVLGWGVMSGMHAAPRVIANVVSTGVLKPPTAILLVACCAGLAVLFWPLAVAHTLAHGLIDVAAVDRVVLFSAAVAALVGAGAMARFLRPVSSTQALLGGLLGAALVHGGVASVNAGGVATVLAFVVLAPLVGALGASILMLMVAWPLRRHGPRRVDNVFRRAQVLTTITLALAHGGNQAQKTIGLLWLLLMVSGYAARDAAQPPAWTVVMSFVALALGMGVAGWRVMGLKGQRIAALKPLGGAVAEGGASLSLLLASALGAPVSTLQVLGAATHGADTHHHGRSLPLALAHDLLRGAALTLVLCAALSAALSLVLRALTGT